MLDCDSVLSADGAAALLSFDIQLVSKQERTAVITKVVLISSPLWSWAIS